MNKTPGPLLRDIRNMKRNHTMTQKQMILSAKQLKKARSSEQIQLNQFLDLKNEKIKNIDDRLLLHQNEIQRNNSIISELTNNFLNLKDQMVKEKQKSENEERRNKLLRQEVQRTNKMIKIKNLKVEQLSKKYQQVQKENQHLKNTQIKFQESQKQVSQLKKQVSMLQETVAEKKNIITQKDKENSQLKDNNYVLESLKKEIGLKNVQIFEIKQKIEQLCQQKDQQKIIRMGLQQKVKNLDKKLDIQKQRSKQFEDLFNQYKKSLQESQKKIYSLQAQHNTANTKLKSQQGFQVGLRAQLQQYRCKFDEIERSLSKSKNEIMNKDQTIQSLRKKVTDFQTNQMCSERQIKQLRNSGNKIQALKKKAKTLQELYKTMVPQIQCPFGHQLNNPVTIIPCGHNYCLGCKKGYTKECMLCNGKLKIEAVYRNELMDDIIGIINGIRQIMQIIR